MFATAAYAPQGAAPRARRGRDHVRPRHALVTELLYPGIEFSVLVGLPVGLAAGAVVAAAVFLGSLSDGAPWHRRVAIAVGGFGAATLAVFAVGEAAGVGTTVALAAATGLGLVVVVATYAWLRRPGADGGAPAA